MENEAALRSSGIKEFDPSKPFITYKAFLLGPFKSLIITDFDLSEDARVRSLYYVYRRYLQSELDAVFSIEPMFPNDGSFVSMMMQQAGLGPLYVKLDDEIVHYIM